MNVQTLVWDTKYNANLDYMRSSPNPYVSEIMKTIVYVTSEVFSSTIFTLDGLISNFNCTQDDVSEIVAKKGLENLVFFPNSVSLKFVE